MNYTYSKPNCVNVTELRRDGISFPKKTHGSVREDWKQYNQTLDNEWCHRKRPATLYTSE